MRFSAQSGLVLLALAAATAAQTLITCYGVDGLEYADNVKCADSDTCCGPRAECMPNRLCKNPGQEENMFVRGPCSHDPYDEDKCGSICIYNEGGVGFTFPRVELCDDGSYCCGNIADCCRRGRGVFLDATGNITSNPSSSSAISSSTTTSEAASSTEPAPSTTGSDTQTSPGASNNNLEGNNNNNESEGSNDMGLKVGLGVGLPLAAISGAVLVWFLLRRRKKEDVSAGGATNGYNAEPKKEAAHYPTAWVPQEQQQQQQQPQHTQYPQAAEMDSRSGFVYEMDGGAAQAPPQQGYYGR